MKVYLGAGDGDMTELPCLIHHLFFLSSFYTKSKGKRMISIVGHKDNKGEQILLFLVNHF